MTNFSFIKFLTESVNQFDKTVALVGGSYRPPTSRHLDMVIKYSKMADEVKVIISDPTSTKSICKTCLGTTVTPEMSKQIWELYIKRYDLQNVSVEVSTEPTAIAALFKYVDSNLNDVNVIFGISKNSDAAKFKSAEKRYADNEHINLIDPASTAVDPYEAIGKLVSAADICNSIDDPDAIKTMLPEKLTEADVKAVIDVLSNEEQLSESDPNDSQKPLDETEDVHLIINDDVLQNARIAAYNVGQTVEDPDRNKEIPVNPKKFPTKAVDVIFPVKKLLVEVFLDTKTKKWDSDIVYNNTHVKLSPDQMGEFFNTRFYSRLMNKLRNAWPLSDKLYGELYAGIENKEMNVGIEIPIEEGDGGNDKSLSNKDVNHDKKRDYTASGRRIVTFSDTQVSKKGAKFYCWPNHKNPFRWSQWKDWKKIKPLCRLRFKHGAHVYGMSLSTLGEDYDSRGFRGYDLTQQPPVQWLSKEENMSFIQLNIVEKFLRKCVEKITTFVDMDPEEVYKKINAPDKISVKDIAETQSKIRKTMNEIIKNKRIDSFKWK